MGRTIEQRIQELEDREAIRQALSGYSCAIDGCNVEAVGSFFEQDAAYAVGDIGVFEGREAIEAIARDKAHLDQVAAGVAHFLTPPYIVIEGDAAVATCHTMLAMHGADGFFIGRVSASRIEFVRQADGGWKILRRQNWMMDGAKEGPAMLARFRDLH